MKNPKWWDEYEEAFGL